MRRLAPALAAVQLRIAELIATHELVIADRTLVGVANYAGCASRSEFAGTAAYGYGAAKSQGVWEVRLILRPTPRVTGRVHAGRRQREGVRAGGRELATAQPAAP